MERNIELRARKRAERNRTAEQEKEPEPATVFFWRRVYLKLEKHSQWLAQTKVFDAIMATCSRPDLCTHSEVTALFHSGNKFASQTMCQKCEKIVIYNHTREGVITWMRAYTKMVDAKKIPAIPPVYHPEDPNASRYCRRCVHPMIQIGKMQVCNQHQATKPCRFMKNGHLPPGDDQNKSRRDRLTDKKKRL